MNIFSKIQKVEKLSVGLKNLYLNKIIRDVAGSLIGMFGVIFFYVLSNSFAFAIIFWLLSNILYFVLAPWMSKFLKYKSLHIFMLIATVLIVGYYLSLYFLSESGALNWFWIVVALVFLVFNRAFYWIPYHIDLARFINTHHRGRQVSFLGIAVSFLGIVLPIISALIIARFGFSVLFILAMGILFISIFPLFFVSHTREEYTFGYLETFKKLFSKNHIKTNLAYVADGFQDYLGALIWPIFIFILLDGKYLEVGLISSAIVLISCVVRYIIGEATDKFDKRKLMRAGSWLYGIGWLFKAIIESGLHIFLVGIYHNFTGILMRTPFDVLMYEIAADEGHYVDEFTVMREMALTFGRIVMMVMALILLWQSINIVWIFVLGAIVSVFINLISKEEFYFQASK
ncbi:MAG: hypothetical protein ABIF17_02950 [Patescibacteria group bacterium]